MTRRPADPQLVVRVAAEGDLAPAEALLRAAFDTYTGSPGWLGDGSPLRSRWRTRHDRVVVAVLDGQLVGSNAVSHWGAVGWFGPLSVAPRAWGRGLAHVLVDDALDRLHQHGASELGLFTFADSPRHLGLYARHGYWPGALVLNTSRPVGAAAAVTTYGGLAAAQQAVALHDLRQLTEAVCAGWDITSEVRGASECGLGDTVLVHDEHGLAGAAVCQLGRRSEAATGTCRVKVAVVRGGGGAAARMLQLLRAVDALAARGGALQVVAAVSAAAEACARLLLTNGWRVVSQGVAMHRGGPAHHRPGAWVLADWR